MHGAPVSLPYSISSKASERRFFAPSSSRFSPTSPLVITARIPLSRQALTAIRGNICMSTKVVVPVRIISMMESRFPQYASSAVRLSSIGITLSKSQV